jgi:opacity protein-like surface antigen
MLRKIAIATAVLAVTSTVAFANGAPYAGLSAGVITNTSTTVNYRGMPGNIFAGYGATIGIGIYLAGEVSGTLGAITITDNGLRSTYSYGISFIPGLMLSDHTMGYARLGLLRTHFTPKGNVGAATVAGGEFGLGLQTSLTQNWDLRMEYDYIASRSISGLSGTPRTDTTTLGLAYKFD